MPSRRDVMKVLGEGIMESLEGGESEFYASFSQEVGVLLSRAEAKVALEALQILTEEVGNE